MPARHENRSENRQRLMEIVEVVRRHEIIKGLTPEKLCAIIEELGPTFIKLGQILSMRSDILPKEYCEALKKLRSSVAPMPYEQVVSIVERSYGRPLGEVFSAFDEQALGSASIAQAHAAVLCSGESVVVKVQRDGIHDVMNRDILLLKRACKMLEYTPASGLVNFNQVLDEMWVVAQEEMNFLTEATNLERFRALNADVAFVTSPMLYREWTTTHVLVMERIDGIAIDDREALLAGGYDPAEIGAKLADNYVRQIMEDGFFHADPHPGNVRIQEGKIVWIDMGMMGRLTEHDREMITLAIEGVALNDVGLILKAVLGLGEFKERPEQRKLYEDIEGLLLKYGSTDMGKINVAEVMTDLMEVMKENKIMMPHGLTMLARGLTHMEGVLANIAPDINMVEIARARLAADFLHNFNFKKELKSTGRSLLKSVRKMIDIPSMTTDLMDEFMKGQTKVNLDLRVSKDLAFLLRRLVRNIVMGLWVMALLISSSIICTTDMTPKFMGIPALGAFGYLMAVVIMIYVFVKHIFSRK